MSKNEEYKIYLVGGAVRDKLLGLPVNEKDWVVVGATPEILLSQGFKQVGKDFPVFLHPETHEEYALARTERKTAKGYYGFACDFSASVTLEEDLLRRDFTINAMAEDEAGNIIDPFQGQLDLKNKILRHVSLAFREDPVRILRLARFATRLFPIGFTIAPETHQLMCEMVEAGEIEHLVPERVWKEMSRSLKEDDPTQFIEVLRSCGALKRLWPELDKLWGIPQPAQYHPEIDTGIHVMMVLKMACQLTTDPITRFAALCHDLGKGSTPPEHWPSHRGHEELGVPLIQGFCSRYRVPTEYKDLATLVSRYHLHCHRALELKPKTLLTTLERLDVFRKPERFEKFLMACEADARGRLGFENIEYIKADRMRAAYQAAKSVDIQALMAEGTLTGEALKEKIHQQRVIAIKKILLYNQ